MSAASELFDEDIRRTLVLRVCSYLQHLDLGFNLMRYAEPSFDEVFALVPRLRTLKLTRDGISVQKPHRLTLDRLPQLASLRLDRFVRLNIADILNIAQHSTLDDEVCIESGAYIMHDSGWIGLCMKFPISVDEDERKMAKDARHVKWDGYVEDEEEESEAALATRFDRLSSAHIKTLTHGGEEQLVGEARVEMQRMRAALTRTQPTQRSCEVRLALAEWLHRRLRRAKLHTNRRSHPKSLLRCMLRQQLREFTTAIPAAATAETFTSSSSSEQGRARKRARVVLWLDLSTDRTVSTGSIVQ